MRRHRAILASTTCLCILLASTVAEADDPYSALLARREKELDQRRATPAGVLPLLGLMSLWERVPPDRVERALALTEEKKTHPLVHGYGLFLRSLAQLRRGRVAEAAELRRRAGFLDHWLLCGPFDSQGKRGHAEVHAVEKDLAAWPDLVKRYPGKEQQVAWRGVPRELHEGRIPVASLIQPSRDGTVYLHALVASDRDQIVALRLGTGGAFRVFVNSAELAAKEVFRPSRPDQESIALPLRRGTNRLVIKETVADGSWEVYVRLTRPDGGPVAGVRSLETPASPGEAPLAPAPAPAPAARRRPPLEDLGTYLGRRLESKPDDPARLRDLALYHARVAPTDATAQEAEKAVQSWIDRGATAGAYLLLSRVVRDRNRERAAVEQALAREPGNPWARLRVAELTLRDARRLEAQTLLEKILADRPDFFPAEARVAELQRGAGLERTAAARLDRLIARHPAALQLVLARADLAQAQNEPGRAEALYRRYLTTNHEDLAAHRALVDLALRRGDGRAALAEQEAAIRFHPHLAYVRVERARLLAGAGRIAEAIAECQRALAVDPRSTRALDLIGQLHLRAGRRQEALKAYRRSLDAHPQNADLRAYLAFLEPGRGKGMAERHRIDPRPLIAAGAPRAGADEPAVVLLDLTATEVHRSGLSRTLRQRVVRVLNNAGAKRLAVHVVQFNPDRQNVEVKAARVHRATGGAARSATEREIGLSEPWAKLWYDMRGRVLDFTGLQPGDTIEIEYIIEDVAADNLFADYFGDVAFVQEDLPVQRFEYALITPKERSFYFRHPRLASVRRSANVEGELRIFRWSARDVPKVVVEPGIPGWSEVADYLHVSTYKRWEDVARWYWGLVRDQLKSSRTVAETARKITAGARDEQEKIRAVQSYVAKRTRYIGLEFGIHGYKPYAVDQVLARKFGDCKDKASLLVALLGEVGIDATLVAVRTRNRGGLESAPASLAAFNHAIAYLPKQRLYLDGTAEFSGSQELPWQDQGVAALHIDRGAGTLRTTPVLPASSNVTRRTARWVFAADGQGKISEETQIAGQAAAHWRSRYQVADQRRQSFEKAWNDAVGGAKVLKVEMHDLEDLERTVRVVAELQVQSLARRDGPSALSVALSGREWTRLGALVAISRRRQPLGLEFPWLLEETIRVAPPPGWRVERAPAAAQLSAPFGAYRREVKRAGADLEVKQTVRLDRIRVEPAEYPAFRAFLLQIDRTIAERINLAR